MLYEILEYFKSIRNQIYSLYRNIKRGISWGWFMRDNYDWDYHYVEIMLLEKLRRLRKEVTTNGHLQWDMEPADDEYKTLKKLDLAIYLLNRQVSRDSMFYAIHTDTKHEKKWGQLVRQSDPKYWRFERANVHNPEEKGQERAEFKVLCELSHKIYVRDRRILYHILEVYGPQFWD